MASIVCDTSALQYLHQLRLLHILPELADHVLVPDAVVKELHEGHRLGHDVPDPMDIAWMEVTSPREIRDWLQRKELGPGERAVMQLAHDMGAVAVMDDGLARQAAAQRTLSFAGTLGLLLDAKGAGLIARLAPLIDELETRGFRLAPVTRAVVLSQAGEPESTA